MNIGSNVISNIIIHVYEHSLKYYQAIGISDDADHRDEEDTYFEEMKAESCLCGVFKEG